MRTVESTCVMFLLTPFLGVGKVCYPNTSILLQINVSPRAGALICLNSYSCELGLTPSTATPLPQTFSILHFYFRNTRVLHLSVSRFPGRPRFCLPLRNAQVLQTSLRILIVWCNTSAFVLYSLIPTQLVSSIVSANYLVPVRMFLNPEQFRHLQES